MRDARRNCGLQAIPCRQVHAHPEESEGWTPDGVGPRGYSKNETESFHRRDSINHHRGLCCRSKTHACGFQGLSLLPVRHLLSSQHNRLLYPTLRLWRHSICHLRLSEQEQRDAGGWHRPSVWHIPPHNATNITAINRCGGCDSPLYSLLAVRTAGSGSISTGTVNKPPNDSHFRPTSWAYSAHSTKNRC